MDLQTIYAVVMPALPYVAYALGFVARIFVPYLLEKMRQPEPMKFDWLYVRGQLAGAIVALIPTLAGGELLTQIGTLGWLAAFAVAYFGADIGRAIQKVRTPAS